MTLRALHRIASNETHRTPLPQWVSSRNSSLSAFNHVQELRIEKQEYISSHYLAKDYRLKRNYQISGSEIARLVGITPSTLLHTSSYSSDFRAHLNSVNRELDELRHKRLERYKKSKAGGLNQHKKDELRGDLASIRAELQHAKNQNAVAQVEALLAELPLPIKRKLGLNV